MGFLKALPVTAAVLLAVSFAAAQAQVPDPGMVQNVSTSQVGDRGRVLDWFSRYDAIRRQAQMSGKERQQADDLLGKGMSVLAPGADKDSAHALLTKLVDKYGRAKTAMHELPIIPETEKLHRGYYQYFGTAHDLFANYLTLQDNLFARDDQGQPVMGQLLARKQKLEELNNLIQDLDKQTRAQYNVPAYKNPNS